MLKYISFYFEVIDAVILLIQEHAMLGAIAKMLRRIANPEVSAWPVDSERSTE